MQVCPLEIACACNDAFAPDCGVMLASLLESHQDRRATIHFLHDDKLPARQLQMLQEVVTSRQGEWKPIQVTRRQMRAFVPSTRYGFEASFRLLLPEFLPALDRVLYIDADCLVLDRLDELFDASLDGYCLAAVTNPLFKHMHARIRRDLGLQEPSNYFNSGVLLLNLKMLRESGLHSQLLDFIRSRKVPLPWVDQDPLNAVLHGHRKHLHPRWNAMTGLFELPWRFMPYSQEECRQATTAPAIVHFTGPYKPWHYRNLHPLAAKYHEILSRTPWRKRSIEGRTLLNILLRPLPPLWAWYVDTTVYWLQRRAGRLRNRLRRVMQGQRK